MFKKKRKKEVTFLFSPPKWLNKYYPFFQVILNFLGVEAYQQNWSMLAWPTIWPKSKWQKGPLFSFFLLNFILSVTKKRPFVYPFSVKQGYICYKSNRWSCSCSHVSGHRTFFLSKKYFSVLIILYILVYTYLNRSLCFPNSPPDPSLMSAGWGCIFQRLCSIT